MSFRRWHLDRTASAFAGAIIALAGAPWQASAQRVTIGTGLSITNYNRMLLLTNAGDFGGGGSAAAQVDSVCSRT